MKNAAKKEKVKKNNELKETLCDIVNKISSFSETDKKLEELVNYCSRDKSLEPTTDR